MYVTVLAFATIEDINICQSCQLFFLAVAKKFHPNASFESAIHGTSYAIVVLETVEHIFKPRSHRLGGFLLCLRFIFFFSFCR